MYDTKIKKVYAGIGSRETPKDILQFMRTLGETLGSQGWTLRSGHAEGADQAWEDGHVLGMTSGLPEAEGSRIELYLPWAGFRRKTLPGDHPRVSVDPRPSEEALVMARVRHPGCPYWPGVWKLFARNMHIILGKDLQSPVDRVYYWSEQDKNGKPKGGTASALKLAQERSILCVDLRTLGG